MADATMRGLDTTDLLSLETVNTLAQDGYSFVIKYCANTPTFPNKRFSHVEAAAIHNAGMKCGFVFEMGNTSPYFISEQGSKDAASVLAYFEALGVPEGVTAFAAYDYDGSPSEVTDYAESFHAGMIESGYFAGCYGSGNVCSHLIGAGFSHYGWLAQSRGWGGYESFLPYADIVQGMGSVLNLSADPDTAKSLAAFW